MWDNLLLTLEGMRRSPNWPRGTILCTFGLITTLAGLGAFAAGSGDTGFSILIVSAILWLSGGECLFSAYLTRPKMVWVYDGEPEPAAPQIAPQPQKVQPAAPQPIIEEEELIYDDAARLEIVRLFAFLYIYIELGQADGAKKWPERGVPVKEFERWMDGLEKLGIVAVKQGRRPEVKCNFRVALQLIAAAQGDPKHYWRLAIEWFKEDSHWVKEVLINGESSRSPIIPSSL